MNPKLYLVKITTEDDIDYDMFASCAPTLTEATAQAHKHFVVDEGYYQDEDVFELYPQDQVSGYKVTLTKI